MEILRLRSSVHAYRRMSIAPNASTVNPHFWYRQPSPSLPSWYTHSSTNYRSHKVFNLRYLSYSDVRCNDGTKAGYYVRRSKDLRSKNWLIYLEGGWYCFDEATCISRQITNHALFSSRTWHMNRYIGGVLSWDDRINPNYHNYNILFVPYCSSDLWSGKKRERTGGYYFHGSRILTAVIDDLLRQPEFFHADKVVFAGSSAGGIGVMLNIDRLARRLRRGLRYRRGNRPFNRLQVSGLVDSAWFLNYPTYAQAYSGSCTSIYDCPPEEGILRGIGLWQPRIPRRCRMAQGKKNFYKCYLGPIIYPHIRTPTFIIQSLFDEAQLQMSRALLLTGGSYSKLAYIQNLGRAIAKSLDTVQGVFAPACTDHEILTTKWRSYPYWYFHLQSPQSPYRGSELSPQDDSFQETQQSQQPQMNSSMIFLSKLVAVLNRPKTDKTAMRGGRENANRRTPRDVLHITQPYHFRIIDRCSLDVGPEDEVSSDGFPTSVLGNLAAACAGRSHMTPLCNPSCRALTHPRTMERLSVVSLYELYGVDSAQLAANVGVSVSRLKALPVKTQMRMLFCRPV
ncbi:unnamed protein product [Hymenolepis diminuta]|uniref:Uncharacterized protein n=1 Tax=Hymenolepis diminuta TaxID=6216 RepID=A0A0R3SR43_HYMDI|nr:unnamed protein product [Hymenolepis diminuta]